jgi:hypothetical protein
LVAACFGDPGPIPGDDSHGGKAKQPAKPLAALAIWMKYLRQRGDTRDIGDQRSRSDLNAFATLCGASLATVQMLRRTNHVPVVAAHQRAMRSG